MAVWDFDMNGDGWVDHRAHDLNGSGMADLWHIDSTGDGFFDQIAHDRNGDGYADVWYADPNLDGWVDHIWYDTDGDGFADSWQWAAAGTSMGWEAFVQPDASGGGTTIGGTSPGWTVTDGQGNPVDTGQGTMTMGGATPLTGMDRLFVEARQNGSLFDQLTIWNMLHQQRSMSWMP